MSCKKRTVEAVRDEIVAATADLRAVAREEQDKQRNQVADWLDGQFIGIADRRVLRKAASNALSGLYRGGMGSFQDVGTEPSSKAVKRLYLALRRANSWFLHNPRSTRTTPTTRP
ncbi:hypothetical protein [Arthrobacter sp. USHLN218]|uniref:hypothetical protein n=1 Tax=Arthrobacter sp. USHLN218 TaxID=3081232 RepID=UPI00301B2A60